MKRTIAQALIDEIHYPLPDGFVANKLLARGLEADEEFSDEIINSNQFNGAVADCLWSSLILPKSFSEGDKSFTRPDTKDIVTLANTYYAKIGEPEKFYGEPTVQFG